MRTLRLSLVAIAVAAVTLAPAVAVAEEEPMAEPTHIAGVAQGVMTQDYENPMGCADWVLPDGTTMPAPTHVSTLTGVTNVLGPATLIAKACYVFGDPFENVTGAQWSMSAENGDGLSGTYSANCIPDFRITAGSGTYEGASGRIVGIATNWGTGFSDEGLMRTVPSEWRFEGIIEF